MYLYNLYGHDSNEVFQHDKKFSKNEFKKICNEVPLLECYGLECCDEGAIKNHLIKKYGFKPIEYQAGFFTDTIIGME